ncbi:dephospho-CoA kinase [Arthrobacter sp. TmT3-37]
MLRIGLTGGIAAGKSVVARRLAELGAVVVDADLLARAAVEPGSEGLAEIVAAFGTGLLTPDGALDRPALGRLVFADDGARERLNTIVHPRVRAGAARLIDGAPAGAVVVEDIPLLVETGQASRFHLVVVVDAPDELRLQRMVDQRGMRREDAEQRMEAQVSRTDRLREADAVLTNDRGLADLLAATDTLWHQRILPFRNTLDAGAHEPGANVQPAEAGLPGTSGLGRRIAAKLRAALPASSAASIVESRRGAARHPPDDVSAAAVSVLPGVGEEFDAVSGAIAAAGFPRVGAAAPPGAGGPFATHRWADPATDVTVVVTAPPAPA